MEEFKQVKVVFADFKQMSDELANSRIEKVNFYRKSNKLELCLITNCALNSEELTAFTSFLKNRFKIEDVTIKLNPLNNTDDELSEKNIDIKIKDDFKKIIAIASKNHPIINGLIDSTKCEIASNEVKVFLINNGIDLLKKQKIDKLISDIILDIYGVKYKVTFNHQEGNSKNIDFTKEKQRLIEEAYKISEQAANEAKAKEAVKMNKDYNGNSGFKKKSTPKEKVVKATDIPKKEVSSQEVQKQVEEKPPEEKEEDPTLIYGRNSNISQPLVKIKDIGAEESQVQINGEICNVHDEMELKKTGKFLLSFDVYDGTNSITCKCFVTPEQKKPVSKRLYPGAGVKIGGKSGFDNFAHEVTLLANTIVEGEPLKKAKREDQSEIKRVELHMHTNMSQMDGITPAQDLINRAIKWGWKSIAITDHGVVQSFPEAHHLLQDLGDKANGIKIIYGVEAYIVNDRSEVMTNVKINQTLEDSTYCVFDLETTGTSFRTDSITEVGIMKVKNGEVIDTFESFVNPERHIPEKVQEITHITDDMVKDAPTIDEILPKIMDFFGDSILVAHNANFDTSFIRYACEQRNLSFDNTYLDTLALAKVLYPDFTKYKLGIIAEKLGIKVENAHRALDDVNTTVQVFNKMCEELRDKKISKLHEIDELSDGKANYKKLKSYHAIIIAKNYVGLKNLYKLISISNLNYFYKHPLILKSIYKQYSEGLILGSACEVGELYSAILEGRADEDILNIAKDYDYLEIQPIGNNEHLVREGRVESDEDLRNFNRKIIEIGEKLEKMVVATCDVHFMDPQDEIYRRILQAGQGYDDSDQQAPLYLRTTEEMLEEFKYLGEEKAYEVVVTNTNKIADMCERIEPISPEKCPPHIPGCEKQIEDIAYKKAHELYGDPLPEIVEARLKKELDSIITNGFSVMYIIAQKLVWKSNEDGYIVGSRGSVGSSFAANMTGITEVNSLPPHYRCPNCKYSDFEDIGEATNGFDLPDKKCPKCGHMMQKDGMDIPFETFLGFNGDKEPDIDLNFSGEYQAKAHKYTEVIFGKGTTFKAGTVGTVADKTAYGYVKKYYEEKGLTINNAEADRISKGCTGVKRTTGQHPGGIIVVPKGREIYEFTPIQHPADDPNSDIITTHFDYHSIDQNLLKLDILGHDDPTVIRMLKDITGLDPTEVPLDDKETMSIYSSTTALGITPDEIKSEVGTFGIPESGTKFVRGMLNDTKPTTFDELLRISGLSHGTNVWLGNAQDLVNSGTATLKEVICTRDDIMNYLITKGLPPNTAFKIMEGVRKGKVAKGKVKEWPEYVELMKENNVPEWYIKSCEKIKYLFPKAHAAAYVTNAFRIAWYKVHIPKAYYCAYFSIRADAFDSNVMCHGHERVLSKMREIEMLQAQRKASKTDEDMYETLEIVNEMYCRGINFLPIDIYESSATKFKLEDDGIRPPLNSIPGLGTVASQGIETARVDGEFMSMDDLRIRSKIGKSAIETLKEAGCLQGMSESNQMSLFA